MKSKGPEVWSKVGSVIFLALYVLPLVWLIATSLKTNQETVGAPAGLIFVPSLAAYRDAFDQGLTRAVVNSLIIATSTTLLTLALAVPAAYGLARSGGKVLTLGLGVLITFQMVPHTSVVIPFYKVLGAWGLLGTLQGVVLADASVLIPFSVLVLRPFYHAIPIEVEEAAAVDGASLGQILVSVVLPLVVNGIVTVGIFLFIIAWGEFLFAISFLTDPQAYPISALLSQEISAYGVNWPGLMALAVVTSVPVVIIWLAGQQLLAEGLSLGAVK